MRHAANLGAVGALDDQQLERPFSLQLQRDARLRLQAAREQHGRRDALAEQGLNLRGVLVLGDDLTPRFLETHERTADAAVFEDESLDFVHPSFLRSASLTCCGFALPFDAFMTCPTRKPSTCCLPARNCSTCAEFAAITSSTSASMLAESEICTSPRLSMISATVPSPAQTASNTSFAILPEIVPSAILSSSTARAAAEIFDCPISSVSRCSAAVSSPCTQFAATFAAAFVRLATVSK